MRKLFLIIWTLSTVLTMEATDRIADINAIKKSPDFLYAEATMKTADEAAEVARDMLREEIIRWTAEEMQNPMDSIQAQEMSEKADTIIAQRVDMMRVFVYIDKATVRGLSPSPIP